MPRFALDQDSPIPIVDSLRDFITEAELAYVRDIDPRMAKLEDWQLLLALHHEDPRWD